MNPLQHSVSPNTLARDRLAFSTELADAEGVQISSSLSSTTHRSKGLTWRQWLPTLSLFMVLFNTWGFSAALGSFQTYYEEELLVGESSSRLSWISTATVSLMFTSGFITGPAYDYGYIRFLILTGSSLEVLGLIMVGNATEYYQVLLSQGICVGVGCGILFTPTFAAVITNIENHSPWAKAVALVPLGSGIGGIVYPIMFTRLLEAVGFAWTTRIMACVAFGTFSLSYIVLLYQPVRRATIRPSFDLTALKDISFVCTLLANAIGGVAFFIPLVYLPQFAQSSILNSDHSLSAVYLTALVNGASIPGHLLSGLAAAKARALEAQVLPMIFSAVLFFCWISVRSEAALIVWSIAWGFASSFILSLRGMLIPALSPSLSVLGTRTGMYLTAIGIGMLLGNPVCGALLETDGLDLPWWRLHVLAGVCMFLSSMLTIKPALDIRYQKDVKYS